MIDTPTDRPRLGISTCLLGDKVRYDGNHTRDPYITGTLGRFFDFVSICPEVAAGLGVPRPPVHLVGDPDHPRAVGVRDAELDVTDALQAFSSRQVHQLGDICGYILKSRSPSCGMERVKIRQADGSVHTGSGIYAHTLMDAHPLLPVEEDGRLGDPDLRDNFLERVFTYRRWQAFRAAGVTQSGLEAFHADHKLSLMAHDPAAVQVLGRLAANGEEPLTARAERYIYGLMAALRHRATPKRQCNVLQHALGYLKRDLDGEDKAELLEVIDAYREGRVPLLVPVTLLKHHLRRRPVPYLARQTYFFPSTPELLLRRGGV